MEGRNEEFHINKLLEETENEVWGGESSDDEPANLEVIEHESNTEQSDEDELVSNVLAEEGTIDHNVHNIQSEDSDSNEVTHADQCRIELNIDQYCSEDDDLPYSERVRFYSGKPKKDRKGKVIEPGTKWYRKPPPLNVRTPARNIVTRLPGVKGAAKNALTPLQGWNILFDNDMIDHVVSCTNKYIEKKKNNYARERDAIETSFDEIKALIGVLYVCGSMKASHLNTDDIWAKDGTGIEFVMCTMSKKRFHFLLQHIRFDDVSTRANRIRLDKITHIREIFEKVVSNSELAYTVSEYTTLDEHLEGFRGRCSFRVYMKNKPAKYGIKVFLLCDARTYYTVNMEIYAGNQPDGPFEISNKVPDLVKRMIRPISGTNRNVTIDNWFTSIPLALDLLKDHKLTIVGTLRKDKREIPPEFKTTKDKRLCSSTFGFHEENMTLVSYVPKQNKVVLGLSTMHYDNTIDDSTGENQKPHIITFYNKTKGGVDVVDRMCSNYSVGRASNRWPLTMFFFLLDVVGINSHIIYEANTGNKIPRKTYLKNLGKQLAKPYIEYRSTIDTLPKDLRSRINFVLGKQPQRRRQLLQRKNAR